MCKYYVDEHIPGSYFVMQRCGQDSIVVSVFPNDIDAQQEIINLLNVRPAKIDRIIAVLLFVVMPVLLISLILGVFQS